MAAMQRSTSAASLSSAGGPRCRLCWGEETDEAAGGSQLISPCNCRGTVGYIHVHCLQHWLEVKRQQGASRNRTVRCEVCHAKYNARQLQSGGLGSPALLPDVWSDPYAIAAVLHGTWRAYVVASGLWHAYTIYRSINTRLSDCLTQASSSNRLDSSHAAGAAGRNRARGGGSSIRIGVRQPTFGPAQPLQHHLTVNVPLDKRKGSSSSSGGSAGSSNHGSGLAAGSRSSSKEVLATVRDRFDRATMVQVYWYTAMMGLTPTPPNADAFAGMALGATVGGMVAQLVFLPMLGSGKVAALGHSCRLLLKCLVRLLAAEACGARGYRVLAGLIRGLMQRWQRMRARRRGRQQEAVAAAPAAGVAQAGRQR